MPSTPYDVRTPMRGRLAERRGLVLHLIVYVVINVGLVLLWTATGPDDFFWPALPLLFWGAGLLTHVKNVFPRPPSIETDVDLEAERLDHRPAGPDPNRVG